MLFLLLYIFPQIHSELITYTLYQTNDICSHNWQGSICLPTFALNKTDHPLLVKLEINNHNQCPTQTLVYVRSRQCIYCSKDPNHIHCHHQQRVRRMTSIEKEHIHRNHIVIISVSLLGILLVGSLFTLFIIKRSKAHTNLLELLNPQPNPNIKSINHIKLARPIKSTSQNQLRAAHLSITK